MRTPEDLCLLCLEAAAVKKNSHVVPRFLSKSIVLNDPNKKSYIIDVKESFRKAKVVQDSAKVDFIFCPHCESYFSVLERRAAKSPLLKLRNHFPPKDVEFLVNDAGLQYAILNQADKKSFHLFWISVLWRCSISTEEIFNAFKLDAEFEESLRLTLERYRSIKESELEELIQSEEHLLPDVRYVLVTSQKYGTGSNGMIGAVAGEPSYVVALNEFWLVLANGERNEFLNAFIDLVNKVQSTDGIKIGMLSEPSWMEINKIQTDQLAAQRLRYLEQSRNNGFLGGLAD